MENLQSKEEFLRSEYVKMLLNLDPNAGACWGKMNVQQMVEHMSDYVRIANGKSVYAIHTPADRIPKMQAFLMSEKPFQENTPNPLMPDIPAAVKHANKEAAIEELKNELDHFFNVFHKEPGKTLDNPFFGTLNYEQQIQLLHKHATHHLKQFGVI
jgi:hypothetical protein